MENCIRPHYEKLKPFKSGFIENSIFENNRDPCPCVSVNFYPYNPDTCIAKETKSMRQVQQVFEWI